MNMLKIAAGIAAMAVAGCGSFGSGTRTTYPARITVSPPASGAVADEVVRDAFHRAAALRRMSPDLAVEIVFAEGVYHLSSPIMLGPDMSGSAAAPLVVRGGGHGVVFSGGLCVTGWKKMDEDVWAAPVPVDASGRPLYTESLFADGHRLARSRFPAADAAVPSNGFFRIQKNDYVLMTNMATKVVTERDATFFRPADLAPLAHVPARELPWAQIVVHCKWESSRRPVSAFDAAAGAVISEGTPVSPWCRWGTGGLCYLENVRCGFKDPGDWFFDAAAGKILYRPCAGEHPDRMTFLAPREGLAHLLVVRGEPRDGRFVHDVTFSNIVFACLGSSNPDATRGPTRIGGYQAAVPTSAAVLADGAHNVVFVGCTVRGVGEYAVWFRDGCVSNRLEHCLLTDLGAGGVRIGNQAAGPYPRPSGAVPFRAEGPFVTAFNTVDDCVITHGGRVHAAGVGVLVTHASDSQITHNEISDFFYTGVSVGWVWGYAGSVAQRNVVAFNRIHKIGQGVLADMGGVYTLGTSFGTCVTNNVIFDVDSYSYGGWGLYTDEGSEGVLMENNLVYDTKDASYHHHYGRNNVLRNNILAFSRAGQIAVTRAEPHRSVSVERNIILWRDGPALAKYAGTLSETAKIDWRSNLWWRTDGKVDFNGKTFGAWQAKGNDAGGLVSDPLFVDAAARDFRLKPGSPASKIGFVPFDSTRAGVRGDADWKRLADE